MFIDKRDVLSHPLILTALISSIKPHAQEIGKIRGIEICLERDVAKDLAQQKRG